MALNENHLVQLRMLPDIDLCVGISNWNNLDKYEQIKKFINRDRSVYLAEKNENIKKKYNAKGHFSTIKVWKF